MDMKWLEDLIVLADVGSFTKAAAIRNVTHPAFGRRIRSLESWAGAKLVDRVSKPVQLTPAGKRFITKGREALNSLIDAKHEVQSAENGDNQRVTLATGRTLARTLVADWMLAFPEAIRPPMFRVRTAGIAETLVWLEKGEVDLLFAYHHPSITLRPQGRNFLQKTMAYDRLVPVTKRRINPNSKLDQTQLEPLPYLAYSPSLALAGLVSDHLNRRPDAPLLSRVVECDSADALLEYALKGMGICWLPWSLVSQACANGQLTQLWGKPMEIPFEVRLVRLRRQMSPLAESLWASTPEI
jgi:LysR family transcriptional regulator, hypochlorite-specific transcription factor HypT